MSKSSNSGGGLGFVGALTIAFIVLKLTHVINWSWWWVLSPVWISTILTLGIFLLVLIVLVIKDTIKEHRK